MKRIMEILSVLWVGIRVGFAGWRNDPNPVEGECYEEPDPDTIDALREEQRISLIVAVTVSAVVLAFITVLGLAGKI